MFHYILVTREASIHQRNSQLYISTETDIHVPIEDVDVLVIENQAVNITQKVLSSLVDNGSLVIICDSNHMPNGILMPYCATVRRLSTIRLQFEQPKPKIKRLWQLIVKQKILNQGSCLKYSNLSDVISVFSNSVASNDKDNIEAIAARKYFKILFGKFFARRDCTNNVNAILNYGYSIFRACISRSLSIHGLEPCLGIFHHSELNPFNLADDLIEPFRPIIDLYVSNELIKNNDIELNPNVKKDLISLLTFDVEIDGAFQPISYAIEMVVESLVSYFNNKSSSILLPNLKPLGIHKYE